MHHSRRPLAILALAAALPACDGSTAPDGGPALFRVRACTDQTFTVRLTDPQVIQRAEQLIGAQQQQIITGELARGDAGFNQPWSWHLIPGTISFADVTTEVCDGCPRMVEENLDYWVDQVGRFCPWTTRVVERVR